MTGITVSEAMSTKPVSVRPSTSVLECARQLAEHDVGSLLVREGPRVFGILTEQDVVRKVVAPALDARRTSAGEIMTSPVQAIEPEKDLYEAILLMKNLDIRHLPVLDRGRVVGFLSEKDIMRLEPALLDVLDAAPDIREERRKPLPEQILGEGACEICGEFSMHIAATRDGRICPRCKEAAV